MLVAHLQLSRRGRGERIKETRLSFQPPAAPHTKTALMGGAHDLCTPFVAPLLPLLSRLLN